jgi:hypothetical protein
MQAHPHCQGMGGWWPATVMYVVPGGKERDQADDKAAHGLGDTRAIQPEGHGPAWGNRQL